MALSMAGLLAGVAGCGDLWQNLTTERTADRGGTIAVAFVNNTPYRASFSFGAWDAWDKSPGAVSLAQLRVEAGTATAPQSVPCRRNFAIGTQEFMDRVVVTRTDESTANFDPDVFVEGVNFSSAPTGSDAAALPTEGTARGVEKLLGVDFSCGDELVFTLVQDPDAEGGFRMDFELIVDVVRQ
jgi:hypothetical protein